MDLKARLYGKYKGKYEHFLPNNHSTEDIFLVSFPKSGNTWLRFLIANAIKVKYGIEREVNFFSVHDIIPDVHICQNILPQGPFGRTDLPRLIKSHTTFNPYYYRVILLVRDPRDVVVSSFHYRKNYHAIPEDMDLSTFVRHEKFGINAWVEHTQSWLARRKAGHILRTFLYEDLKEDTTGELAKIMSLMGISLSPSALADAVELCSKDRMKASEQNHMSTQLIKHQKTAFVRKAEASGGQELSEADRQYIEAQAQTVAREIGIRGF